MSFQKGYKSWNTGKSDWFKEILIRCSKCGRFIGKNIHICNPGFTGPHTEEAKRKMSKYWKGRLIGDKNPSKRPEVIAKIIATRKKNNSYKLSEKTKKRISKTLKEKGIKYFLL